MCVPVNSDMFVHAMYVYVDNFEKLIFSFHHGMQGPSSGSGLSQQALSLPEPSHWPRLPYKLWHPKTKFLELQKASTMSPVVNWAALVGCTPHYEQIDSVT